MKNSFPYIIIGALIVILIILGIKSCKPTPATVIVQDTVYMHDTTYAHQPVMHDTFHTPQVIIHIPANTPTTPPEDPNCDDLYDAYNDLVDSLDGTNVQADKITLKDSSSKIVGTVNIIDSVSRNRIFSRSINYQLSFPVITNTLTITKNIPEKHKNSFYIGGGLQGNKIDIISGANAGLLWQNKQGGIFGAGVVYDNTQHLNFQIQKYWKLGKNK